MKTNLTPKNPGRLIELGVDPSKACMTHLDFNGTYAYVSGEEADTVKACINGEYYAEECNVFTLADILSLLPKDISTANADYYLDICAVRYNGDWTATYLKCGSIGQSTYGEVAAPELIDALYELLVWCITNKHLKL